MDDPRHLLVLLRHAKSDWSGGERDLHRPLAKRGRRQAPDAGRWLADHVRIDLAIVSPAIRARQTWRLVSDELAAAPPLRVEEGAYAASERDLLDLVRELPEDAHTVVLVGHNPGLEDLASSLTGQCVGMPTSALAVVAVPGPWTTAGTEPSQLWASGRPPEGRLGPDSARAG